MKLPPTASSPCSSSSSRQVAPAYCSYASGSVWQHGRADCPGQPPAHPPLFSANLNVSAFRTSAGHIHQVLLVALGQHHRLYCPPAGPPAPSPSPRRSASTSPRKRDLARLCPTSGRTGLPSNKLVSAVYIATPADGPSFGTAPAGTCTCIVGLVQLFRVDAKPLGPAS